jgi:phosphatidylglycerol:prolipoprotein diacylglycerol transferase
VRPLIPWFPQPELDIPLPQGLLPWDHIPIHGFGVLVALGFLAGARIAMDRARKLGLDAEAINRLVTWLVIGTFVGGHVGNELMYEPQVIWDDPGKLLRVWDGLSSWGGFLACIPITIWFFRSEGKPVAPYADCIAYGLTVGWFLGRMGCFVAHDHPGTPTQFFLGVYGVCPPGDNKLPDIACHDMGLYEALWALGIFGLFYVLDKRPKVQGFYALMLGVLYGPARFLMEFARPASTDSRWAFGLTPAQYWSALFAVGCAVWLVQRVRTGPLQEPAPPIATTPIVKKPGQAG